MSPSMKERERFGLDPSAEPTQARPSVSLVSWVIRLGCTVASSPGIFGTDPVNAVQQGGLSVF
jgi:hypothetical protein